MIDQVITKWSSTRETNVKRGKWIESWIVFSGFVWCPDISMEKYNLWLWTFCKTGLMFPYSSFRSFYALSLVSFPAPTGQNKTVTGLKEWAKPQLYQFQLAKQHQHISSTLRFESKSETELGRRIDGLWVILGRHSNKRFWPPLSLAQ